MNTAIILAGGTGQRVGADIPKQFITVDDVPIIAYTMSVFQQHPGIDAIAVVCVKGWEDEVERCRDEYGITKLARIIPGGANSMESISNGVFGVGDMVSDDDLVVIHDAVRPLINEDILTDCMEKARAHGNGCASIPMQETIVRTEDRLSGSINIDRSNIMRVQTPQAYRYAEIRDMYATARDRGIKDSVYANTLLLDLGGTVYFSKGSTVNLKITTPEDLKLFKALLDSGASPVRRSSS